MEPDRWLRIEQLFNDAAGLPEGERDAWLRQACGGDDSLRHEVASLLAQPADTLTFLEPPTIAGAAGGPPADAFSRVGLEVGSCKLVQLIAEGGMGAVYEAEQRPFGRRVAVKLLRAGRDSPGFRRRFEHEARILARLRHPAIAEVYEAGTHDDPTFGPIPYLVMELIEDARDLLSAADRRNWGIRERVAAFVPICEAVHHGHVKGVIHRDLKPANILVGADGGPKVIDFGVARAIDAETGSRTLMTAAGTIVGTVPYMSPEQFSAEPDDVDARSDVYSLGVILYRLLCGRLPYDVAESSLFDAARIIKREPPVRPSRLRGELRGDLETILLVALDKERERRYASAAALADDLGRWLDHRPLVASPPGPLRQLALFARRRKAAFLAITGVAAAIVLGLVASLLFAWRAERARADEAQARAHAQSLFTSGRDLAGWVLGDHERALQGVVGSMQARRALVARMLDYLRQLEANAGDDRALQLEIALAYARVASIQGAPSDNSLGRSEDALASLERALAIRARLGPPPGDPLPEWLGEAGALVMKGEILGLRGDLAGARRALDAAQAVLDRADARAPEALGVRNDLQYLQSAYADLANYGNDAEGALRHLERQLALAQETAARFPENADVRRRLGRSEWALGRQLDAMGRPAEAKPHVQAAFEAARAEVARAPDAESLRDLSIAHLALGDLDYDADPAAALPHYLEARKLREQLLQADPGSAAGTRSLVVSLERIGDMQLRLENPAAAVEAFREAVERLDRLLVVDPRNRDVLRSCWIESRNLGDAHDAARDPRRAKEGFEHAIERAYAYEEGGRLPAEDRVDIADLGRKAGLACRELARLARAEGDADAERLDLARALEHFEQSARRYDALAKAAVLEPPARRNADEARRLADECRAALAPR